VAQLAASEGGIWVNDLGAVVKIDTASNKVEGSVFPRFPRRGKLGALSAFRNLVYFTDNCDPAETTEGGARALQVIDAKTRTVLESVALNFEPGFTTADRSAVWATRASFIARLDSRLSRQLSSHQPSNLFSGLIIEHQD